MKAYKEKQFLVFEFEDGKNVKYNLATHECIGKLGKPVKSVCSQLCGYRIQDVISSFEDVKYKKFLTYIENDINPISNWGYKTQKITNIGTFLKKIKGYSTYEQIFSSGVENVGKVRVQSFKDIPKGLIKVCRENNDIILNYASIKAYNEDPNLFINILNLKSDAISNKILLNIYINKYSGNYSKSRIGEKFHELISTYNYNLKSLVEYIEYLFMYEGLDGVSSIVSELNDYARMSSTISNKYNKYPRNFLTTHKITCRNFNRIVKDYPEDVFKRRIDKSLEFEHGDYKIIYPECIQDIKDEAVSLQHCVASYIDGVIEGKRHIMFLRKVNSLENSLVTLEVVNGEIVQARGLYNRSLSEKEQEVVDEYNENTYKKEKIAC
ncbi:PcfJ domain-containing protein [Paraclostridium bifermentans]